MQSNVILFNRHTVESQLLRMKELNQQIKVLQAEYDMIKNDVVSEYFVNHEEYKTEKGLVLATYKSYIESRFNSTKFRVDFSDIYDNYKEEKAIYKFLLK